MNTTIQLITQWAHARNLIHGSDSFRQLAKLTEEMGELASGIAKQRPDIIAELKKRRLSRFLRVKTELNKQALLAEADKLAAKPIEGLSIITDKETITISAGGNHA